MHEVTTFRVDVETDGRHATVRFGDSIDEDLARRDFTINAIAYSPATHEVRDPFGGAADLADRRLRAVGDAGQRMREDRLRALRAIRFASRFGLRIDPPTWTAILESAPYLSRLSAERVRQEIEKTLQQVACPSAAFRMWRDAGAFRAVVPSLAGLPDVSLAALDFLPLPIGPRKAQRAALRLAALFLDRSTGDVGAALRELRFSNQTISWTALLVERWREVEPVLRAALLGGGTPADAEVRRWVSRVGRLRIAPVLRLSAARWCAGLQSGETTPTPAQVRALYRRAVRSAFADAVEVADLAVDGDDLRAAGIAPGPWLGDILRTLLDRVVGDPGENHRDRLLAEALREYRRLRPVP